MALWWLSFSSETRNLGVAIVEANSFESAIDEAHRRKLNPGGEVLGVEVPEIGVERVWPYRNRLIQADEVERVLGPRGDHMAAFRAGIGQLQRDPKEEAEQARNRTAPCYFCGVETAPDFLRTLDRHPADCPLRLIAEECIERGRILYDGPVQ
jgi:hypothetical protein